MPSVGVKGWLVGAALAATLYGGWGLVRYETEPETARALDGDSLVTQDGRSVRILGINTKERGQKNFEEAKEYLGKLVEGEELWLEPDRVIVDRFGRGLFWVWIDCESIPVFWDQNYMKLTERTHREGLRENPEGCKQGKLVSEEMIKAGYSDPYFLKKKGEMKYEKRLMGE